MLSKTMFLNTWILEFIWMGKQYAYPANIISYKNVMKQEVGPRGTGKLSFQS